MATEKKNSMMTMLFIGLLVLNILFGAYVAFFKQDAYSLETLKVGGRENMKMAKQLYKSDTYIQQQKTTLEQILASMWTTDTTQNADQGATQETTTTAVAGDASKFAAIAQDGYILGNKNAKVTIIEYSDLLCPFCKRHYNAQTIENLVKKYPDDVNMIFRQMPLPQLHPTAPLWAQGAVCAGKLWGSESYYDYLAKAFAIEEFTEDNVKDIASTIGLKKAAFADCLTSEETIAAVNAQVQEGQSFGINGTPGNLVVDNEKWTYTVVAGAYPTETFEAEINKILGK